MRAERADRDKTTVVIADDHTVVRQGLRLLIDNEDGLQVVAEAGTVPDAERLARAHRPSVLVLDLNMPGGSSLEAIPRLRERHARHRDRRPDDAGRPRLRAQGAAGRRAAASCSRRPPTRSCSRRSASPPPATPTSIRASARAWPPPRISRAGPPDDLSERELEVLRLIALGHTNSEIADQLFLSTRTVETHRAHIQQKIRRTSRAELVRYALDHVCSRPDPTLPQPTKSRAQPPPTTLPLPPLSPSSPPLSPPPT